MAKSFPESHMEIEHPRRTAQLEVYALTVPQQIVHSLALIQEFH